MATKVEICNMALQELGANRIINLTESREEAVLCNLFYETARDEVLRKLAPNFADWYQSLAQVSSDDANYMLSDLDEWEYQYALPVSPYCLRVLGIPDYPNQPYVIANRYLLTNLEEVTIKYTQRVEDEAKFDPLFIRALSYRLAMDLTDKITNSRKTRAEVQALYNWAVGEATLIDAVEGKHEELEDTWVDAGRS